jgi:hypothetical protein
MPYYLVTAKPKEDKLPQLKEKLNHEAFISLNPFGQALTQGLVNARLNQAGFAQWEEEDYCHPPLAAERKVVLDHYFTDIAVKDMGRGHAWAAVDHLPYLFPELHQS